MLSEFEFEEIASGTENASGLGLDMLRRRWRRGSMQKQDSVPLTKTLSVSWCRYWWEHTEHLQLQD